MQPGAPKSKRLLVAPQVGNLPCKLHEDMDDERNQTATTLQNRSVDTLHLIVRCSSMTFRS